MKKIILLVLFILGIFPCINKRWHIDICTKYGFFVQGEAMSSGEEDYLGEYRDDLEQEIPMLFPGGDGTGGSDGVNGGGDGGGNNPPTQPVEVPKYAIANIAATMTHQSEENYCVPAILAYTEKIFDKTSKATEGDYIDKYNAQFPNNNLFKDGVSSIGTLNSFINDNFNTEKYKGVKDAIDKGHPILISQPLNKLVNGVPAYHEILIIGYDTVTKEDGDFKVYYMNPETGEIESINYNDLNSSDPPYVDAIVITGHK